MTMPPKEEHNELDSPGEVYIIKEQCNNQNISYDSSIYCVFHMCMSIIAIYLSVRCNKGIDYGSLFAACVFPYFYIIYSIFTYNGICRFDEN